MIIHLPLQMLTKRIFIALLFSCIYIKGFSATYYSRGVGNWNNAASWSLSPTAPQTASGVVPGAADDVLILSGHDITVANTASIRSFTINSGGSLVIGSAASNSGSLTYSVNSTVIEGGRLVVNAGGKLNDSYTGSYPGGTAVLTINGGTSPNPALQISGLVEISNLTISNGTDTYARITAVGNVLVKNAFTMNGNGNVSRLLLNGLLIVKGVFTTSNNGNNIETSGTGSFSAQGGTNSPNTSNTVDGTVNYCQALNPCSIASSDCGIVCTRIYTSPLPITLIDFKAIAEQSANEVRLEWITASEENNEYFAIERSKNAVEFEEISRIPGAGNASLARTYIMVDKDPLPGVNYYRLKQVDIDGKFSYSKTVSVKYEASGFVLSPNPSDGKNFTISWKSPVREATIAIYNQLGHQLYSLEIRDNNRWEEEIHMKATLKNGVYLIKVQTSGQQFMKKLIVHN